MDFSYGVPIVEVHVNGHGPYRMIVDTTAVGMIVSEAFANEKGFSYSPFTGVNIAHGFRWIEELQIGHAKFSGFDCAAWFRVSEEISRYDGVLGRNVFMNVLLTLDYPNSRVILRPYQPLDANDPQVVTTAAVYSEKLAIPIHVDGTSYPLIIDSRDLESITIRSDLEDALRFEPIPPYAQIFTIKRRIDHLLSLGEHIIEKPIVTPVYDGRSSHIKMQIRTPIDYNRSSIGSGLLKHFTVTLDQRSDLARFERAETTPIRTPPVRTYVTGRTMDYVDDAIVVGKRNSLESLSSLKIFSRLPRFNTGDRIIQINGISINDVTSEMTASMLDGAEDIAFTVERGERILTITAPIITLIP